MQHDHPAITLFEELLDLPAPSGREEQVAAFLRQRIEALGYTHETDAAGNVLVRLAGRQTDAPAAVFAAHMDEIGIVVTGIEPDGSLRVDRSGGLFPWKIGEGPVEVLGDEDTITALLSMGSTHSPGAGEKAITWGDVRLRTDMSPRELAAAGVRVGSTAVPVRSARGPVFLGNSADPLVAAWTFDDRMGVVILLRALEAMQAENIQPARPTIIAFTVHEEGGCHGAKVLAARERPEVLVAIDGCPIPADQSLTLDGRPGVWSKDRLCHFDQRLVRDFLRAGREAGVEVQTAVYDGACSDASMVYSVGAAPRVATFGHVRDNSHGYEVARLSCFDNALATLLQFLRTWE